MNDITNTYGRSINGKSDVNSALSKMSNGSSKLESVLSRKNGVYYTIDQAKEKKFNEQKDEVLSKIPKKEMARFGEICFSSFYGLIRPMLIMNPYDIPPGKDRDSWMSFFDFYQRGRMTAMTHVVYSYADGAYLLQTKSNLIPYDDEIQSFKSYVKNLRNVSRSGKKLTKTESQDLKAFDKMVEDRVKDPSERHAGKSIDFLEEHYIQHHVDWGPWRQKVEGAGGMEKIVSWKTILEKKGKGKKGGKGKYARPTQKI